MALRKDGGFAKSDKERKKEVPQTRPSVVHKVGKPQEAKKEEVERAEEKKVEKNKEPAQAGKRVAFTQATSARTGTSDFDGWLTVIWLPTVLLRRL